MEKAVESKNQFEIILENLTVRKYSPDDYKTAQKWWMTYNAAYLEKYLLPPLGLVVENLGEPIAIGWIYTPNALVAQIAWVVSKPRLTPKLKVVAATYLMQSLENLAKELGYKMIQMFSDRPGLNKIAQGLDWRKLNQHEFLVKSILEEDNDV